MPPTDPGLADAEHQPDGYCTDPVEYLAELLLRVLGFPPYQHQPGLAQLSPPAREWFTRGVLQAAREGKSIGDALGLHADGERSLRSRLLLLKRDRHIIEALRLVSVDPNATSWARCQMLVTPARRMSDQWGRIGQLSAPEAHRPPHERELFWAIRVGIGVPGTARGLYYVVKRAGTYPFHGKASNMLAHLL